MKHNRIHPSEGKIIFFLTFIHFIHLVDFVVIMPLGPTLMEKLNIGPAAFASLVSAYNFAGALTGLIISLFADKFEKKRLLTIALIGLGFGTITCGLSSSGSHLIIARSITGFFGGFLNPLIFALVAEWVPEKRRGRAMGWVMSGFSLASVFGVPLGLLINDYFGFEWTFYTVSFFIFMTAFGCYYYLPDSSTPSKELRARELFEVLGDSFRNTTYLKVFLYTFIISGTMFLLIPMLAPYAVKNMGIKATELKYMYLVGGILTVFTARFFGLITDYYGGKKTYMIICLLSTLPIYLYTHSGVVAFYQYIIIGSVFMSLVSGRMIPAMTLTSMIPSSSRRGQFMGILNSVRAASTALGSLIVGLVVVEGLDGRLQSFDLIGKVAIVVSMISILLTYIIFPKERKTLAVQEDKN